MIIKIIPETEFEKQRWQEVEYVGVKDFLIFGNKKDRDGDLEDFHDWTGSYRYLEGSLYYFMTTLSEERKSKAVKKPEIDLRPPAHPKSSSVKPHMIKKGTLEDGKVQVIDVEEMAKKMKTAEEKNNEPVNNPILQFPQMPQPPIDDDFAEPPTNADESKGVED